jgi:hypothetical protein
VLNKNKLKMGKGQPLSTEEKLLICQLKLEGCSTRHIYTKLNRSYGVVHSYLRDPENYGKRSRGRRSNVASSSNSPVLTDTYSSCVVDECYSPSTSTQFMTPIPETQFPPVHQEWNYPQQQQPGFNSEVSHNWHCPYMLQQHSDHNFDAQFKQCVYANTNTMRSWQRYHLREQQLNWDANPEEVVDLTTDEEILS